MTSKRSCSPGRIINNNNSNNSNRASRYLANSRYTSIDSPRCSGVMFGGLREVPTDPDLDPPPGVCFNCHTKGHKRIECPLPQLQVCCHNCGRQGVKIDDCPRCSSRHREYLTRLRKKERAQRQCLVDGTLAKAAENLGIACEGGPKGTCEISRALGRAVDRVACEPSLLPQAKRSRANSASRNYYFHLGRETPESEHTHYSSIETVYAEDDDDIFREYKTARRLTDHQDDEGKLPSTKRPISDKGDIAVAKGTGPDGNDYIYKSIFDPNNNNNNTWKKENNDDKWREPSHGDTDEQTDASGGGVCNIQYSCIGDDSAHKETTPAWSVKSCATSQLEGKSDVQHFLKLMRKITKLPVSTQEVIILQVVTERERLSSNKIDKEVSDFIDDPVQEFTELVDAIAHLSIDTQNIVIFGIAAAREKFAKRKAA